MCFHFSNIILSFYCDMVGKSTFQQDWLNPDLNPEFAKWARAGRDRSPVFCELCNKSFDISSMGKQAL